MKERPILFSAPMVRALLDGSKTQTRRVVNSDRFYGFANDDPRIARNCPYGQPGDRLWVRETFFCNDFDYPDGPRERLMDELYYRADGIPDFEGEEKDMRWRPSIHMPRWASRITLEITEVRAQRLSAITYADARAEGMQVVETDRIGDIYGLPGRPEFNTRTSLGSFDRLWASINGQESWGLNPFVWAVSFKVVTQ